MTQMERMSTDKKKISSSLLHLFHMYFKFLNPHKAWQAGLDWIV